MQCDRCEEKVFVIYTFYVGKATIRLCKKCADHEQAIRDYQEEWGFKSGDFIEFDGRGLA